jgi:endo-1,4-beta-mannosidase
MLGLMRKIALAFLLLTSACSTPRWVIGSNYIPSDAVNSIEMWRIQTFDPKRIDLELGWAENLHMNTMRVFLHDLLWQENSTGFLARIDAFLSIAKKHHIQVIFVLFDSCWNPKPILGMQPPPLPGRHNSQWVQGPGLATLNNAGEYPRLKAYVQGVIKAFAQDSRVLAWDLWNEPDNLNRQSYRDPLSKLARVEELLPQVFL